MTSVHELSRREARRIAVRAQLLDRERPTDVLDVVRRLSMLQVEPTAAIAPSADVVLWSRLGSTYSPQELRDLLDEQRLVELRARVLPAEDLVLHRAEMAQWPGAGELLEWQEELRDWVEVNDECRRDLLERLRCDGPLPQSELPDTCVQPWASSGWNDGRNVRRMLDMLVQRGEVALHGRDGRDLLWDLASRVYPDEPPVPLEEALRVRAERCLRTLGIARARAADGAGPLDLGDVGEPAVVEGVRGRWRVDPDQLGRPFAGRAALLSPLDRLVFDRKRMADLFEFDYQLEMYKPAAQRRWGYWAMPVLHGDRLVGKLDALADREAGELRVAALHWDVEPSRTMAEAVDRELRDLARWLGLALVETA